MDNGDNPMLNCPIMGYAHHRIILDDSGKPFDYEFLEVNATFEKLSGLKNEHLIGSTARQAIPGIEKLAFDWIGYYGEIALGGDKKEFEQYSEQLDTWYRVHAYSTAKMLFTTMLIDITESKKQAEELESFFSVNLDLMCIADLEGNFVKTNEAWSHILGYTTDDLNKKKFLDFVHPDDLPDTLAVMADLGKGDAVINFTNRYRSKEGTYHYIEWRSQPKGNLIYAAARDVTERKQAESALKESEYLHRKLLATIPDRIIQTDLNGTIIFVNDNQNMNPGYFPKEELLGKNILSFIAEQDRQKAIDNTKLMFSGALGPRNYQLMMTDGNYMHAEVNGDVIHDIENNPRGMVYVIRDITDRERAVVELEKTKEQFSLAVDGTDVGIWDWNLRTNELFLSKRWKEMLGYQDHEIRNEFSSFSSLIYEDDAESVHNYIQSYLKGGIEKYVIEFRMKHKNGSLVWILAKGKALRDENGIPYRMAGSHTDISKRKEIEKELRENQIRLELAIDAGEHGFWDWNLVTNITYFSPTYYSMLGYENKELPMNLDTFKLLIHPDDNQQVMPAIQQCIEESKPYEFEFRLKCKDGSYKWIMGKGKTYHDDNSGKPVRAVGVHIDINERKMAEDALKIAKEQAEAASRAKSEFLANMSHEIRTPLNGVIGFTDLLKSTPLSPVQQQYVNNANISAHALLGIINDILDFSKIEAGMLDLELIKTDMAELLENSVDIVQFAAGKKNLELLLNIDTSLPRFAVVDPIRLKQILANLLGNAVKFTDKGEVELKVTCEKIAEQRHKFSFSVRDTGIGISEEQKNKLFKAFSQADSSTTRKFGGTGLGLIISEMIAEKMGSTIRIDSQPGDGATFYFDIISETEEGEILAGSPIDTVKRCLIIDDNDNNSKILERMMAGWNIASESCDNGLTALERLESSAPFDVIICDYDMPYFDGLETIHKLREHFKLNQEMQPVILLHSSSDDVELHKKCDALGVRFMVTKPVKVNDLYTCLCSIHDRDPERKEKVLTAQNLLPAMNKRGKALSILIAEDIEMNMLMIRALLGKLLPGAELVEAVNGLEVLKILQHSQPDLILMDVQMPGMDGLDTTIKIRELEKKNGMHVPVVALTAGAFREEQERCLAAGMDDFLTKPVEPRKIKELIDTYLAGSRPK